MTIRHLAPGYAVSPQIAPADAARVKELGFVTVICNRPDGEVPAGLRAEDVRAAVEAQGMAFVANPVMPGAFTAANVAAQGAAIDAGGGPVLAYCASGNRSSIVWALHEAGRQDPETLIATAARAGYNLAGLRPDLEARARGRR
ncbi:MAG: TIGR01244 family phosphatase [Rhodobacteraceae bacterium]|nr:TIGR01244 family phosphatase [Paracoccaceae bacterium]